MQLQLPFVNHSDITEPLEQIDTLNDIVAMTSQSNR